jgi:hypothetical protein
VTAYDDWFGDVGQHGSYPFIGTEPRDDLLVASRGSVAERHRPEALDVDG